MNSEGFSTPILFLIFNRPDETKKVFAQIRKQKPKKLYIAADGPRYAKPTDQESCLKAREIIKDINWPCELKTLFRESNLGCKLAVSKAITWFFDQEQEGIILEDDTLPHSDFFQFAESMLEKYRDAPRVMHITGGNYQFGNIRGEASYYFSRISHVWGWASWSRAWKYYDADMVDLPDFLSRKDRSSFFFNSFSENYWISYFKRVYRKMSTWDYQLTYCIMKNRGYCIIPNVNMISNIGFDIEATHPTLPNSFLSNMEATGMGYTIHPKKIEYNEEADLFSITKIFPKPTLIERIINRLRRILIRYRLHFVEKAIAAMTSN